MRIFFNIFAFLLLVFCIHSCDSNEEFNVDTNFRLKFSVDTLSFDTLFTGFGSTTMQFKVYNESSKKILVNDIHLNTINSPYRINVNGLQSDKYNDITIEANDSLFVFVEVELMPNNSDEAILLEDLLVFKVNNKLQGVVLSVYAQDVIVINENVSISQNWTGNRPYLIEKEISVNPNITLTIEEGAKVYFRKKAGLHVHGNLQVSGSFNDPVYFGSTRFEDLYKNVPGQWDGIYLYESSQINNLSHFILQDGVNGIKYQGLNGKLNLEYGVIRNFSENGISSTNVDIDAHDLLILNCGNECLKVENGNLNLYQSTLFNSWNFNIRTAPILEVIKSTEKVLNIGNCIFWGTHSNEFIIDNTSGLIIENSLLKLSNSFQEENSQAFKECIFNVNPEFTSIEERIYTLSEISPCINTGSTEIGRLYPIDLLNSSRNNDLAPDMGAFEFKINKE